MLDAVRAPYRPSPVDLRKSKSTRQRAPPEKHSPLRGWSALPCEEENHAKLVNASRVL